MWCKLPGQPLSAFFGKTLDYIPIKTSSLVCSIVPKCNKIIGKYYNGLQSYYIFHEQYETNYKVGPLDKKIGVTLFWFDSP